MMQCTNKPSCLKNSLQNTLFSYLYFSPIILNEHVYMEMIVINIMHCTSSYEEHPSMTMLGLKQVIETGASSLLLRSSREA